MEAVKGEPHWSTNLKKGIINLWQVNLGKSGLMTEQERPFHLQPSYMRDIPTSGNVFKVMEVCE